MLMSPDENLHNIDYLHPSEREMVLGEWNDTAHPYAEEDVVHALFEVTAQATLTAVAVIFKGAQVTYEQLLLCTGRISCQLQSYGVSVDHIVGLCVEKSVEETGQHQSDGEHTSLAGVKQRHRDFLKMTHE